MAEYYYNGEKAKNMPEKDVVENRLIGDENELGKTVGAYVRQTVTKILLAKNKALLADSTRQLAVEIREKAADAATDDVTLQENYLENLVIKNNDGDVITSAEEMEKWVDDTFYFVLSDQHSPNAFMLARDDGAPQKSVLGVTTEMLSYAENAAQFEGVIAHELGHYFVQRRYGAERAHRAKAINEKMADMHAVGCLHYLGKDPDEYAVVLANLTGDSKDMDPYERVMIAMQDEHGGDVSRLQDIYDYSSTKYGSYVEDLYLENENGKAEWEDDDRAFMQFKRDVNRVYPQERFMSYVEQQFAADEKFAAAVDAQNGQIDFSKLKYEEVMDKLIEIGKNQGFRYYKELSDAAELLARSSKEGLQITPELSQKATLLMTVATDSCYMNELYAQNKAWDRVYQYQMEENIADVLAKRQKGEKFLDTVENVVIAEEFERLGRAPTPKEVGEKLMLIPEVQSYGDKPFMYNGKEVYGTLQTHHFKEAVRTEKQKESDFRQPTGAHFHFGNDQKYLCDTIYQEAYLRDGTRLSPMEVADKLDEVLAAVPGGLDNKSIEYNGKNLYINTYDVKRFLQVYKPQSALLSDQDRLARFDYFGISSNEFWVSEKGAGKNFVDDLQMAVCYPGIDFIGFKDKMDQCVRDEDKVTLEKELSAQVMAADVVRVEPYSFMRKDAKNVQQFLDGNEGNLNVSLKGYARFAVNMPTFEMPREEEAAGKELPWLNCEVEALRYGNINLGLGDGKSRAEAVAADYNIQTPENLFQKTGVSGRGLSMLVKFPDGKAYDFLADENGRITATGARVAELKRAEAKLATNDAARQISQSFRERVKVLDALICVAEAQKKEKQGALSAEEAAKRTEALAFLCATENLETKMFQLKDVRTGEAYDTFSGRQKELAYSNMPVVQEKLIAEDMAFLRESEFFKRFADEKGLPEKPEELVKHMESLLQWNVGEKMPELVQTIIPPMYSVMGVRSQKLESTQNLYQESKNIERDIMDNLEACAANSELDGGAKKPVYDLILSLKMRTIQDMEVMRDVRNPLYIKVGTSGDEAVYLAARVPYYEKMRRVMHLPETDGAPEQLYQNLVARYKEDEVIKNEEQKAQLIKDYKDILFVQADNLDELRRNLAEKDKGMMDAGTQKLTFPMGNGYKMAEYEVARYITNPANPPLDAVKLLQAYPKFEADYSQSVIHSGEFQDLAAAYILEKGGFKDKDFYGKKEIFDLMAHKGLFNGETETRAVFAEELKKAYEKLPEAEKEKAALSMLQDNVLEYEACTKGYGSDGEFSRKAAESTISSVDSVYPIKQYFTEQFAEKFVARIGKEPVIGDVLKDGRIAGEQDVAAYHNTVTELMNTVNTTMKQSGVKNELFALVAEGIEAQPKLAEMFEVAGQHQDSDKDLSGRNELKMRGLNGFNEFIPYCPSSNRVMIDFFTEPYSDENIAKFRENLYKTVCSDMAEINKRSNAESGGAEDNRELLMGMINAVSKENLHNAYDEFWAADLKTRAAVMQRFLNNATADDNNMAIDLCLDKFVDKENPYYGISKEILTTLYKDGTRGKHYSHDKARFMIGAMMAADKPAAENGGAQMSVGDALAKFCSSNGPAWVKFGQALSNLPMLPADIREPMSVLKDKAQSKTRWELLAEVRENMPEEERRGIRRFGKMLGAGSFWETLATEMQDGSKQVLQMMAPGAKKNAQSEFAKIVRTIEDLSAQNTQYAVLDRIVKRAQESAKVETDIAKGFDQYVGAKKNYEAFDRIEVNGVTFEMQLMPWTHFNQDKKTGNGYKMMEMADGQGLAKLNCTPEEKKVLAAGYVATELGILLGGKSWDIDRHGGQQNFDIQRGKDGQIEKVVVGIYDTGALRPAPSEEEKTMIANFYAAVIKASLKGDDVTEVMFDEVKKLEDRGMDATYVSDVQRGCIAINDLVEYQKAGVDKDGKTTASQSFGQKDFIKLFGAVLSSGAIDRHISDTLLEKLVTDKSVYAALAKEAARAGVSKMKRMLGGGSKAGENGGELDIVLQTRGCLQTKEHNRAIDEAHPRQSSDNAFAKSESRPAEKKGFVRKTVRNLQAFALRQQRMRRDAGK